jgi:hypothetical protein
MMRSGCHHIATASAQDHIKRHECQGPWSQSASTAVADHVPACASARMTVKPLEAAVKVAPGRKAEVGRVPPIGIRQTAV